MKTRLSLLILLSLLCLGSAGCWDIKDIKTMQVATLEAIDVASGGEKNAYQREALVVSGKNWGKRSFQVISGSGNPFTYVTPNIQAKTGGDFLYSGIETYIIGRQLAERGLRELVEVTETNTTLPYTIHWVISDGPASEVLRTDNPSYPDAGEYLRRLLSATPRSLFIPQTDSFTIARNMHEKTSSMVPVIKKGSGNCLEITGAGLIDVDRLCVLLNREDAQTASLLRGEKVSGHLYIRGPVGDKMEDLVLTITKFHRRVKVKRENGQYNLQITIQLEGRLHQDTPARNFIEEKKFFSQVETTSSRSIQARCLRLVQKMQQDWKFDAFNLGKYAHARYGDPPPGKNWRQIVTQSTITVEVYTHIIGAGEAF